MCDISDRGNAVVRTNDCSSELAGRVTLLAGHIESSSLYLLRAIEDTLVSLRRLENTAGAASAEVLAAAEKIAGCSVKKGHLIDPEGIALEKLNATLEMVENHVPEIERRRESFDRNATLCGHVDVLSAACTSYLSTLESLAESVRVLIGAIRNHDVQASPFVRETVDKVLRVRAGRHEKIPDGESVLDWLTE